MATRIQGRAIIADLPAEAARAIAGRLRAQMMLEVNKMSVQDDADRRCETSTRISHLNQQAGYMSVAWHQPPDAVVTLRLGDPCWKEILSALETTDLTHGAELVAEAIATLKPAVLRQEGLMDEDGTIHLPDGP